MKYWDKALKDYAKEIYFIVVRCKEEGVDESQIRPLIGLLEYVTHSFIYIRGFLTSLMSSQISYSAEERANRALAAVLCAEVVHVR